MLGILIYVTSVRVCSGGYRGGGSGGRNPPSGPSMNIIIMPRVYEYHYCTPRVLLSAAMKRSTSISLVSYPDPDSQQLRVDYITAPLHVAVMQLLGIGVWVRD